MHEIRAGEKVEYFESVSKRYVGHYMIVLYILCLLFVLTFSDLASISPYLLQQLGVAFFYSIPIYGLALLASWYTYQNLWDAFYKEDQDYYQSMPEDVREALFESRLETRFEELGLTKVNKQPITKPPVTNKPRVNRRKGYVYILDEINGDHYKIGRTRNPKDRIRTFGVKLPYKVNLDLLIATDDMYSLESELHQRFADRRIDGEWFALTPEDIDWLRKEFSSDES